MSNEKTIIEINGIKLEVDMRYARRVEELRIGSPVKVLVKSQYSDHSVLPGIVIGFEPFKELPTILVAYVENTYSNAGIKVISINSAQKNYDIVAAVDPDFAVDKDAVIKQFDRQIASKQREIDAIEDQKRYFETNFKAFWTSVSSVEAAI
jgi:hypothetical protein